MKFLGEQWQRLVDEYARVRRESRVNGLSPRELNAIDRKHTFLIDAAYARLKYAEASEAWYRAIREPACQASRSEA